MGDYRGSMQTTSLIICGEMNKWWVRERKKEAKKKTRKDEMLRMSWVIGMYNT